MERRSFLKSLAAALSAASVPGVSGAVVAHADTASPVAQTPDLAGMIVRSVNVRQESPRTFFHNGTAISDGRETAEVDVEAFFDNETAPLLIDAYRAHEPFDLALPVFRFLGVADQQWLINHYSIEISAGGLVMIRFTLSPASGTLKIVAPVDVSDLAHLKVSPRS